MEYKMKVKEIDEATNYPLSVLSGLTGLGQETIRRLEQEGKFAFHQESGETQINGGEFLQWAREVNNIIEVEKTDYTKQEVNE
jgi:hypothetical protein